MPPLGSGSSSNEMACGDGDFEMSGLCHDSREALESANLHSSSQLFRLSFGPPGPRKLTQTATVHGYAPADGGRRADGPRSTRRMADEARAGAAAGVSNSAAVRPDAAARAGPAA